MEALRTRPRLGEEVLLADMVFRSMAPQILRAVHPSTASTITASMESTTTLSMVSTRERAVAVEMGAVTLTEAPIKASGGMEPIREPILGTKRTIRDMDKGEAAVGAVAVAAVAAVAAEAVVILDQALTEGVARRSMAKESTAEVPLRPPPQQLQPQPLEEKAGIPTVAAKEEAQARATLRQSLLGEALDMKATIMVEVPAPALAPPLPRL